MLCTRTKNENIILNGLSPSPKYFPVVTFFYCSTTHPVIALILYDVSVWCLHPNKCIVTQTILIRSSVISLFTFFPYRVRLSLPRFFCLSLIVTLIFLCILKEQQSRLVTENSLTMKLDLDFLLKTSSSPFFSLYWRRCKYSVFVHRLIARNSEQCNTRFFC